MPDTKITFDPLDVRERLSPPQPLTPLPFDAWSHIGRTVWLDPRRVKPMDSQPRETFAEIEEFGTSLKTNGQRTTILVHPIHDADYDVELTAGERRTLGCRLAGIMVRAEIRPVPADRKIQYVDAVIENFNRKDLTLYETVRAVQKLVRFGYTNTQIAAMVGKTIGWVSNHASLASLDLAVLKMLDTPAKNQRNRYGRKLRRASLLPMDIALQVVKLEPAQQLTFAQMLIEEGMSIALARSLVKRRLKAEGKRPARDPRPKECFAQLTRQLETVEAMITQFHHDMEPGELRAIAKAHEPSVTRNMSRRLRVLAEELANLAVTINPTFDPSRWHPRLRQWLTRQGVPASLLTTTD